MKESISMTTIFQIVVLFIMLFTAIMALTINNSNAFGMKDKIINYIENHNGNYLNSDGTRLNDEIVETISEAAYRTTGKCEEGYTGYARNGEALTANEDASICIREVHATDEIDAYLTEILGNTVSQGEFMNGIYYQVMVFYQLDIPVVKQIYNFKTKGETRLIYQN